MGTVGGNWTRSCHQGLSTPQSPVQHVGWHPAAPCWEKDSVAVVASIKRWAQRKGKRETQQLGHSSSTCLCLEICRAEAVGTSFGETGWALLSSPTCHIARSSIASSLLGNPRWARGQDCAPYHPSRGRTHWKPSLESSGQRLPGTAIYLQQMLTGNTTTKGLERLHLRGGNRKTHGQAHFT